MIAWSILSIRNPHPDPYMKTIKHWIKSGKCRESPTQSLTMWKSESAELLILSFTHACCPLSALGITPAAVSVWLLVTVACVGGAVSVWPFFYLSARISVLADLAVSEQLSRHRNGHRGITIWTSGGGKTMNCEPIQDCVICVWGLCSSCD